MRNLRNLFVFELRNSYAWQQFITLEDFRKTMEVPETKRYGDIKRYAIVAPVKELNDKADMRIEWKETKRGRSVHSLQFTFEILRPEDKGRQAELDL